MDSINLLFNEAQTVILADQLKMYPKEVQDEFIDVINNVPFIESMVSPKRLRAKDLPRDDKGRIIVDLIHPHILEDMDYFRPAALHYKKYGCYTTLRPNANPNSEFAKWLRTEIDRIWNGMVRPSDGEWIPGDLYFYWNYSPILQTKVEKGKKKGNRVIDFPEIWDSTYLWGHYIYQAVYGGKYNNFQGGEHFGVIARRGCGKAHPYHEYIYTPNGIQLWGDLQVGDLVFGDNGKPVKITAIPFDGVVDTYKITLRDGRSILCSDEHLWNVEIHNHKGIHTLTTTQLLDIYKRIRKKSERNPDGIEYTCSIPKNECVEFQPQPVKIDPYTFGLLLGDGTFRNSPFYLTMANKDFEEIRNNIPYDCFLQNPNVINHRIQIPHLKDILTSYGLFNKKSEDKFIPNAYKFNSKDVRLNILDGLIDSDGYVLKDRVGYYISIASKSLAEDIIMICRSLGFNADFTVKNTKYFNKKTQQYVQCLPCYTVTIHTDVKLGKLKRKTSKQYSSKYGRSRSLKTRIVNIEYVGKKWSKCITVNNDSNCYLVNDFVVTHNSLFIAAMMAKQFICGENSEVNKSVKNVVVAADKQFLINDGTLNKFVDCIDFCADNTQFPSKRLKSSLGDMHWRMGYFDSEDQQIERGTKNEVMGLSIKDKPGKIRGKRAVRTYFEEFGMFPNFLETYNTALYNAEEGGYAFGTLGVIGTGGTKGNDFSGALEMIYHPEGYHMYQLPNVFDKSTQGKGTCLFFIGAYMNRKGFYDENGNSDVTGSLLEVLMERYKTKTTTSDPLSVTQKKAELPLTIQDCIMKVGGNIYPVADLQARIAELNLNPHSFDDVYVGKLNMVGGKVEFQPTTDTPIRHFPHKDNKLDGAIEIFKMPEINKTTNEVFRNRYIAGADVYDNDVSGTLSLGSIFVLDVFTDNIVAEFTGRPKFAEDFYEICRRLCLFYNARLCYENNWKGLYSYFSRTHCTYLLTPTFSYLKDRDLVKGELFGNTSYGVRATVPIQNFARGLLRDWLLKPRIKIEKVNDEEIETSYPQLMDVKNIALLQELALYNLDGNFDRHDAMLMLMLFREDVYRLNSGEPSKRPEYKNEFLTDSFFDTYQKMKNRFSKQEPVLNGDGIFLNG